MSGWKSAPKIERSRKDDRKRRRQFITILEPPGFENLTTALKIEYMQWIWRGLKGYSIIIYQCFKIHTICMQKVQIIVENISLYQYFKMCTIFKQNVQKMCKYIFLVYTLGWPRNLKNWNIYLGRGIFRFFENKVLEKIPFLNFLCIFSFCL